MSDRIVIGGFFERNDLCMMEIIGIKDQPGNAGNVFKIFSEEKISVDFITSNTTHNGNGSMSIGMNSKYCSNFENLSRKIDNVVHPEKIVSHPLIAMLTVYGPHFSEKPQIAEFFCVELGKQNVNILGISTSINSITCVIDKAQLFAAKEGINRRFVVPEY